MSRTPPESVETARAEFGPFMNSLFLGLHDASGASAGYIHVSQGDSQDDDAGDSERWKQLCHHFAHKTDISLEDVRAGLPKAEEIDWQDETFDALGNFELRGRAPGMKLWLVTKGTGTPEKGSDDERAAGGRHLSALRNLIWGRN
jgi:hypothetical protein